MKLPESCLIWVDAMRASPKGKAILSHIEKENCLPIGLENEYFHLIGLRLIEGISLDSDAAQSLALEVCLRNSDRLLLKGPQVTDGRFDALVRVEAVRGLRRVCRDALDSAGLVDGDVSSESEESKKLVAQGLAVFHAESSGVLPYANLGNRLAIVWATCMPEIDGKEDIVAALVRRLAIQNSSAYLAITYQKNEVPNQDIRRPTSLDGIDQPQFFPVANCAFPFGMTAPDGDPDMGVPEVVHAAIRLTNPEFFVLIGP